MSHLRIMVVDDDLVVLETTKALLSSRGYEVSSRSSALGTTVAILREKPDVVLLDIGMPGLNGDELLRAIRASDVLPHEWPTEFIVHSGLEPEALQAIVSETGILGAIEKTADRAAFLSAFEALLQRRGRQRG